MSFYSSLFSGKHLPSSIWDSGILHLPEPLATVHMDFLVKNGWFAEYKPGERGGTGGQLTEEAREHVINRFLNSAARMQFVCADPGDDQPEVREMVFGQLGDGRIFLLDLAAGNGAGTLAMLSLLCELRLNKLIPKLPINVNILGVDFSADALGYYAELLDDLKPWLSSVGIELSLRTEVCDLAVSGDFNEVLEEFFYEARQQQVKRFLCVISALSGAGKEGFDLIHDSLKIAAAGLSHSKRNSSLLWVEPYTRKAWLGQFADTVRLVLGKVPFSFAKKSDSYEIKTEVPLLPSPISRKFDWHDPHVAKIAKSHVSVMAFRSE
jgi:hypothetical protein